MSRASRVYPKRLYPFQSRRLAVRPGLSMHYLDEGPPDGEAVVMIHGNPTWSFYYRNLVLALRSPFRCIVPDHIGCGLSDKPGLERYAYRLRDRIDDLTTLLNDLVPSGPINLVLHDWGGMIGMAYAAQRPERIRRLVLLNTAAFPLPASKLFPWALWVGRNTTIGAWLIRGLNAFARAAVLIGTKRRLLSGPLRNAYLLPYNSWANRLAVLRFVQTIPLKPTDEDWSIVAETAEKLTAFRETPALICFGMKDFVFDKHFLAEWERRLPNAEIRRFPDCGHYILEDATEEVVRLIADFLQC